MSKRSLKLYKKEIVLEAIKDSHGIVKVIAERLKCDWYTAQRYVQYWVATRRAFEDELEKMLDMAESNLFNQIEKENLEASKWVLSKKGKHRGYGDKIDMEHSGEIGVKFVKGFDGV